MAHKVLTVKYITSKTCFCYLSPKNSEFLTDGVTLKISYDTNNAYLSSQPSVTLTESEIGLNYLQSKALSLQENDSVMVTVCDNVPSVRRIVVSPASNDDYEILEMLAEGIESTLLNQIRVVNKNQNFIIWISDSFHVTVNVDFVFPVSPGRLDNLTEVEIAQPKNVQDEIVNEKKKQVWNLSNLMNSLLNFDVNSDAHSSKSKEMLEKYLNRFLLKFSLRPISDLQSIVLPDRSFFDVFAFEANLPKSVLKYQSSSFLCVMKLVNRPVINNIQLEEHTKYNDSLVVKIHALKDNSEVCTKFPILYVNDCVFKAFNAQIGAKVLLENVSEPELLPSSIEIYTTNKISKSTAIEKLKSFSGEYEKLLLNADVVLHVEKDFIFLLKFIPSKLKYCVMDSDLIRNCNFTVADSELNVENTISMNTTSSEYYENFCNYKTIIEDTTILLKMGLFNENSKSENVLLTGKPGSGKTCLTKLIANKLMACPLRIHVETLSCKSIKGKTIESMHRVFWEKILNLIYYQPSVLILDDLHTICEKVNQGNAHEQNGLYFNRVSELLSGILNLISKTGNIAILATSESVYKLNQHIFTSRGQHLFKHTFNIDELTKEDKLSFLKMLFAKNSHLQVDLEQFSVKMEGFVAQDLVDFVNKAIFESLKEKIIDRPTIIQSHCEAALKNITALSLRNVQLHSPGDKDFSDIGGLDNVKKILVECMMWPVQYPNVFEKAPLRLQSGLLLYGPPGTGKTILAGAAAKHCGLRLISIKGPELLSKYIGASEEAVRNVFEKAQSAKPCILFFDEFDSLAPRRGHDSTGVTDRVVNQLLTQLDGVESLSGVCVLAATSRPDLLDPALLRPGRLDKQIMCPLPDESSRLKILKSLSKRMNFADDVDLNGVAKRSRGYSGADLQAILYTAQLSAVDHLLKEVSGNSVNVTVINQTHVEEALKTTRPSLTKEENFKYQQIYYKFQQGNDVIDIKSGVQKATLA